MTFQEVHTAVISMYNGSHGCCTLFLSVAKQMYELVEVWYAGTDSRLKLEFEFHNTAVFLTRQQYFFVMFFIYKALT